jgi:hypothetical protein
MAPALLSHDVPLLIAIALVIAAFAVTAAMLPFAIVFRYRYGTQRRRARGWVATVNVVSIAISATIFLVTAAVTNAWVPHAFVYSAAGLAGGCVLGLIGLVLTRWEADGATLFYRPSRFLVLTITLVVTARLGYGFWRAWHAWQDKADAQSWLVAVGVAGSMAAGAVVLGYYLMYWAGLRFRIALSRRRPRRARQR